MTSLWLSVLICEIRQSASLSIHDQVKRGHVCGPEHARSPNVNDCGMTMTVRAVRSGLRQFNSGYINSLLSHSHAHLEKVLVFLSGQFGELGNKALAHSLAPEQWP